MGDSAQFTMSVGHLPEAVPSAGDTETSVTQLVLSGNSSQRGGERYQQIIIERIKSPLQGRMLHQGAHEDGQSCRTGGITDAVLTASLVSGRAGNLFLSLLFSSSYSWSFHSQDFEFDQK